MLEFLFNKVADLNGFKGLKRYQKGTPAQMFACEYCKLSKSRFFIGHLRWVLLYVAEHMLLT